MALRGPFPSWLGFPSLFTEPGGQGDVGLCNLKCHLSWGDWALPQSSRGGHCRCLALLRAPPSPAESVSSEPRRFDSSRCHPLACVDKLLSSLGRKGSCQRPAPARNPAPLCSCAGAVLPCMPVQPHSSLVKVGVHGWVAYFRDPSLPRGLLSGLFHQPSRRKIRNICSR